MPRPRSEVDLLRTVIDTQRVLHARTHDVADVMRVVIERSRVLTDAESAVVELLDGGDLVYRAAAGAAAGQVGTRVAVAAGLSGRCVTERRALRCDDAETDPRVDRARCRQVGVRSMLVVPLLLPVTEECVGVLEVRSPEPDRFDDHDVELLDAMGDFIASALRHALDRADQEERAMRDPLTGLANRSLLLDRLAVGLARASRSGEPVTVLFLDLDGFDAVNDQLGHEAGDQVLRSVARALSATVRPSDTVSRLAGDEFVVACEGVHEPHVAELLERVRWAVATAWPGRLPVCASVGIARSTPDDTAEGILHRADLAMYDVKRARAAAS
jgi:diguanylate cyclase (GGDEF)-like protein